ncbi:MAG: hypothetical protein KAW82_03180 [Desulfurellaceae bacterium]|nr:hypothetical protein [Desulfurellaceae bacterium]
MRKMRGNMHGFMILKDKCKKCAKLLCAAKRYIKRNGNGEYFIAHQPETKTEYEEFLELSRICPFKAIIPVENSRKVSYK